MSKLEQALPKIIKSLKSTYGRDFFNEITLQLNQITEADYTFIAQVDFEAFTSKTISLVVKNQLTDNFEYHLDDTPCAILTENNVCLYPKEICRLFPKDQLLIDMNIEGYVGVPLNDSQGQVIGIIVALHENEIKDPDFIKTLFELFSGRIAVEMERRVQENNLNQLNIKLATKVNELIKSETKLSLHIQNTPLGCITWDRNLYCTQRRKVFGKKSFAFQKDKPICRKDKPVSRKEYLYLGKKDLCFSEKLCVFSEKCCVSRRSVVFLEQVLCFSNKSCVSQRTLVFLQEVHVSERSPAFLKEVLCF